MINLAAGQFLLLTLPILVITLSQDVLTLSR
jgi:hypothetical protein